MAARCPATHRRTARRAVHDERSERHLRSHWRSPRAGAPRRSCGRTGVTAPSRTGSTRPVAARSRPAYCSAHARIRRTSPRMPMRSASHATTSCAACERPRVTAGTMLERGQRGCLFRAQRDPSEVGPGPLHLPQAAMPLATVEHGGTQHGPQRVDVARSKRGPARPQRHPGPAGTPRRARTEEEHCRRASTVQPSPTATTPIRPRWRRHPHRPRRTPSPDSRRRYLPRWRAARGIAS